MERKPALVIHPYIKSAIALRQPQARLEEAAGLARAIELEIADALLAPLVTFRPATLFGRGKVEEIGHLVEEREAGLVIVDAKLSPVQQKNLETAWNCKVIDRTALILEIFGARARTAEGKLQVELAALDYQKGRLVRSWTHLERQRGGFGFLGGPGESQIEIDRRLIRDRMARLKKELETVTRTRELHRAKRRRVPYPVIALVGYTNAGKSTLFNRLTGAGVMAKDLLFATLDPTMRSVKLPSGMQAILSDTVGFVSDLPTELIAAFRATLEEVLEADILLHVRDISHEDSSAQKSDVDNVLKRLFGKTPDNVIEVLNKTDLLPDAVWPTGAMAVSALSGEGLPALLERLDTELASRFYASLEYLLPLDDGKPLAWLHRNGQVNGEGTEEEHLRVQVGLTPENAARFEKEFGLVPCAAL